MLMVRLKVKEVAEKQGINMSQLSRRADVAYGTVMAIWHQPYHDVSLYILDRLSKALHTPICDLIEQEPDR